MPIKTLERTTKHIGTDIKRRKSVASDFEYFLLSCPMDQKKNYLSHIEQQFAHCWFVLVRQGRDWKMDRDRGFSSFYVTNKEINKSLPALTGGGKAGHLSLSIYEVVASTPRPPPPTEIFKRVRVGREPLCWAAVREIWRGGRYSTVLNSLRLFSSRAP